MRWALPGLLTALVAAVVAAVHEPIEDDTVKLLKTQLLAGLGMKHSPDMRLVNTTAEHMQRMTRRYYKNLRESDQELLTYQSTGVSENNYLIFNPEVTDLNNFKWAKLCFPNSTSVDISNVVRNWRDNPNEVLQVKCQELGCQRAKLQIMVRSSRNKRSPCNGQCCRRSLKINFKEIGFDWVVKPEEFEAYYCKGRCRNGTYDFASTHALIQSILSIKNDKVSRPCCAPRKLRGLDLLHYNDQNPAELVVTRQKGMIVKECACS